MAPKRGWTLDTRVTAFHTFSPRVSEPKPSQEVLELSDPSDTIPVRFQEIFKNTLRKFSKAQGAQLGAL